MAKIGLDSLNIEELAFAARAMHIMTGITATR